MKNMTAVSQHCPAYAHGDCRIETRDGCYGPENQHHSLFRRNGNADTFHRIRGLYRTSDHSGYFSRKDRIERVDPNAVSIDLNCQKRPKYENETLHIVSALGIEPEYRLLQGKYRERKRNAKTLQGGIRPRLRSCRRWSDQRHTSHSGGY